MVARGRKCQAAITVKLEANIAGEHIIGLQPDLRGSRTASPMLACAAALSNPARFRTVALSPVHVDLPQADHIATFNGNAQYELLSLTKSLLGLRNLPHLPKVHDRRS